MIQSMPRDFNPTGYDLKTTDGTIWKIVEFEDHFELQSSAGNFELMKLDGRFTVFAPGYRNINLHGFEVAGTQYELEEAVQNENWVYVPVPEPEPVTTIKRYSKLAIMRALETAGLWATVKNAITEAGRWDAFILAQDLAGDDPDFLAMKAALDAMLPVDSETILQGCELGA